VTFATLDLVERGLLTPEEASSLILARKHDYKRTLRMLGLAVLLVAGFVLAVLGRYREAIAAGAWLAGWAAERLCTERRNARRDLFRQVLAALVTGPCPGDLLAIRIGDPLLRAATLDVMQLHGLVWREDEGCWCITDRGRAALVTGELP
jgi:hypothetical protein